MVYNQLRVVVAAIVGVASVGLLYAKVAKPLIEMGTGDGSFTGPFSQNITQVDTVVPLVLAALLLGVVIWMIVSTVREERSVRRRGPP